MVLLARKELLAQLVLLEHKVLLEQKEPRALPALAVRLALPEFLA
jgi:hypothetical protein